MSNDGTYKHDSVSPIIVELANDSRVEQGGLTKREHFAGLAMQAMISIYTPETFPSDLMIGHVAVNMANALIKALNAEPS